MGQTPRGIAWALLYDGRLRAGWRLLLFAPLVVVAVLIAAVPILAVVFALGPDIDPIVGLMAQSLGMGTGFLVVTVLAGLVIDARFQGGLRRGLLRGVGIGGPLVRSGVELVGGVVLGAVGLLPALAVMAFGGLSLDAVHLDPWRLLLFVLVSVGLFFAATFEELAFRGYLFGWVGAALARPGRVLLRAVGLDDRVAHRIGDVVGFAVPALVTSALFGLVHGSNPGAGWLSGLNTGLAGLWFAVLVLRTRTLWLAIGAHWSWNVVHGLVLGLPVSGLSEEGGFALPTVLDLRASGPDWLAGGGYGVEGSVGATVACVLLIAISAVLPRRRPEEGLAALVGGAPEGAGTTSGEPAEG